MKKYLLLTLSCITTILFSQQQWQWAKSFNFNSGFINSGTNCLTADANGNNYISININSTKACLLKTDSLGNELWRKFIDGNITISQIRVSSSGLYMIGYFENTLVMGTSTIVSSGQADIFFARLDLSGNVQWLKKMGGSQMDQGNGLSIDHNGNIYITGSFIGSAVFEDQTLASECGSKLFIAKYDQQGTKQFLKAGSCMMDSTQGSSFSAGTKIEIDGGGNIFCAGLFSYFKMDTFQVWGGGGPYNSYFLTKLDPAGNTMWAKQVMIHSTPHLESMTLDNSGHILLTGYHNWTNGGSTMTQKINAATGHTLWTSSEGGNCGYASQGTSWCIAPDNSNSYIIGSETAGYNNCSFTGWRLMMAKYDQGGTRLKHDTIYTHFVSNTNIIKSGGYYVIGGVYDGALTLGTTNLNGSTSTRELFLARFKEWQLSTLVSTNLISEDDVEVYPNPSQGSFTVKAGSGSMISVYDPFGKCVLNNTCITNDPTIDLSQQGKGVYFVEILSENERSVRKIVIH